LLVQCPAEEVFYGGAVGGGKTDGLLGDYARGIDYGPKWVGLFMRRYTPDMSYVIRRAQEIFCSVYGETIWKESKNQFQFPSGAILQFRAADRDIDALKHQGQQYQWIGIDELTQYETDYIYTYLFHRMRTAAGGIPVRMRSTGNPGGPGHNWVKARFIDPAPPGVPLLVTRKDGSTYWRVFIKSRLEDNRKLMEADPGYAGRVYEISDPIMAQAMREGDWNLAVGAAFPEWNEKIHVIDNAPIPTDRKLLRSMDWGYADPYACLWGFVYDGDLIICDEAYGWGGKANTGTQEAPSQVRARLSGRERMNEMFVPFGWLDSQCWDSQSGMGMVAQELMGRVTDPDHMVWHPWKKGPNSRVQQKQGVHQMLQIVNGRSRLKIMRRCHHGIRTLPSVTTDKNNREDVDTNCEDHWYDALRAMIASGIPTREELRRRTLLQMRESYSTVRPSDLAGGGF
jgi:hypothetical protein